MSRSIIISEVHFTSARDREIAKGLVGFITCIVDDRLKLDSIALRRTVDGRLTLSFPSRRDGEGREHPFIRPIDTASRIEIEEQIFAALPGVGFDRARDGASASGVNR